MTPAEKETLTRIDERTKHTAVEITQIKEDLDRKFVTQHEFKPVKTIAYGLVGAVLLAVLTAGLATVFTSKDTQTKADTQPTEQKDTQQ